MFYRWLLTALLCVSSALDCAITLKGDTGAASDESFSFRVQDAVIGDLAPDLIGTNLYVSAHPSDGGADSVKDFSVSRVSRGDTSFLPLTPEEVIFNIPKFDEDKKAILVANPLYDKGVAFLSVLNAEESILQGAKERPIVVLESDKKTIYMINTFSGSGKNISVLSFQNSDKPTNTLIPTNNVPDATAKVTSGIVAIAAAQPEKFVFAAAGANGGSFGDVNSGIVFSAIGQAAGFTGPLIIDAETGSFENATGNRARPLDISSTQLKIGSDLASIGTIVDMIWHKNVGRLYIALQATGGAAGTDGARSIAIGRVLTTPIETTVKDSNGNDVLETDGTKKVSISFNYKLFIDEIVPTSAISGTDKIVGAVGSSVAVTAHKVREMVTSTALPYLIVLGNVGAPSATQRSVFALPLVSGNSGDDAPLNGTIANKDADSQDIFAPKNNAFIARIIKEPATTTAQMPLSTDTATKVGGGDILNGDITDLFVFGDTVFATVQSADAGQLPGIFYSQAQFEQDGKVKSWTTWRRAVGLSDATQSVFLDRVTGEFYTLVANGSDEVKIVKRTEWAGGDASSISPIVSIIGSQFAQEDAGVQGLHDFVVTSGSLGTDTPGLLDISLLVATGYKKILMAETSRVFMGAVLPIQNGAVGPLSSFDDGTITQTFPVSDSRIISVSGGALDGIGPIVAAEVAKDGAAGSNGWLFVGGSGGVAVLSKADGSGWDTFAGLSDGFTGITAGMSFKSVGEFSLVRKLIHDDNYLYVITNTEIVRIDLTTGTPGLGSISATTIASAAALPELGDEGTFLDVLVSEKLMIIGTNNGLFRLANGLDARTVDENSAVWTFVDTPEGVGPVRQLFAVSQTGRAQDIARKPGGGTLYTLSAYRGKNQAQLHRFDIAQVTTSSITDMTLRRVRDVYVEDIPSYFTSFGLFRNIFATDGSLLYGAQSAAQEISSQATTLTSPTGTVQTGSRFIKNLLVPVDLADNTLVAGMIQNSATGTWLIAGDSGLRANE